MIDFQNVSKRFGTQDVLINASFRINTGEHAGIVGPNGSGKSTVASIIAGDTHPDSGRVVLPSNIRVGMLHQHVGALHHATPLSVYAEGGIPELERIEADIIAIEKALPQASGKHKEALLEELGHWQTCFEHADGYNIRHRAEAALSGLGFSESDFGRLLGTFSGGWQMRAALTRCLVANPDILVLDEPSNYLDLPAIEWLQRFLRDYKGTLALISHDRYLLNTLTITTIEVANGKTERYSGNVDAYLRDRTARLESRINALRNYERKVEKAERFVQRFQYKATKASQVKSRQKMIERMDTVELPQTVRSRGQIVIPPPPHCGQEVLRLEQAGFTYDDQRWILKGIDLRVTRGEKLALVGHNGLGKTTLLRILAGALAIKDGKRMTGHRVVFGYLSQEFSETMDPSQRVFDCVKEAAPQQSEQHVRNMLGGFGFPGDAIEKKVEVLSGGEKVRLSFARLLVNPPNVLLLDEPTTHLDIEAREALEKALKAYEGTLFLVSHDTTFVDTVANGLIIMSPPGIKRFHGSYRDYRRQVAEMQGRDLSPDVPSRQRVSGQVSTQQTENRKERRQRNAAQRQETSRQTRHLKKTIQQAERQIDIFEKEQTVILEGLQNGIPSVDIPETHRRLKIIQDEIQNYTERWEKAVQALDDIETAN